MFQLFPSRRFPPFNCISLSRYPLRVEVEYANQSRLNKLPKPEIEYLARDFPGYDIRRQPIPLAKATELLNRLIVLPRLSLRVRPRLL